MKIATTLHYQWKSIGQSHAFLSKNTPKSIGQVANRFFIWLYKGVCSLPHWPKISNRVTRMAKGIQKDLFFQNLKKWHAFCQNIQGKNLAPQRFDFQAKFNKIVQVFMIHCIHIEVSIAPVFQQNSINLYYHIRYIQLGIATNISLKNSPFRYTFLVTTSPK